jgi:hypothetical protein
MTRDTDPTPPHGIPRPRLSPLDSARLFVGDRLADCADWETVGADPHPDRAHLETLLVLLDVAEALPVLWEAGEADAMQGIADDLAMLGGARRCPWCGEMRQPDCFGPRFAICDWCAEGDEPSDCDGCGRREGVRVSKADARYSLCVRCEDQLAHERAVVRDTSSLPWERVRDASPHPFGGAADR